MTPTLRKSQASRFAHALGTLGGLAVLITTTGCARDTNALSAQSPATTASAVGVPVVVSCEPHQRPLVRSVLMNGATVSQVECITSDALAAPALPLTAQTLAPVAAVPRHVRASSAPVYADQDLGDARVVSAPRPATEARPVRARQVVYEDERPVRQTRSVKKSAIIIGSSAGVGAGVGAAVGGKKGALIGAAIGGGGAAVWDQITRRDR
jgi:hypothetical protein